MAEDLVGGSDTAERSVRVGALGRQRDRARAGEHDRVAVRSAEFARHPGMNFMGQRDGVRPRRRVHVDGDEHAGKPDAVVVTGRDLVDLDRREFVEQVVVELVPHHSIRKPGRSAGDEFQLDVDEDGHWFRPPNWEARSST